MTDAHVEHCCRWHGCKYFDGNCSVTSRKKDQYYPCNICHLEYADYLEALSRSRLWIKFMAEYG